MIVSSSAPATDIDAPSTSASFTEYLAQALDHFADPTWLGLHSPLAAPYFLGNLLTTTQTTDQPQLRGQALQRLLLLVAIALNESPEQVAELPLDTLKDLLRHGTREQQILYWKFVHHPRPPVEFIIDQMIVARATYHRNVKEKLPLILQQMATAILQLVRPALRLEPPPVTTLVGRAALLQICQATLERERTLLLTGIAGVGKSALAAGLAAQWSGPVFWYTLRRMLNDSPGSFWLMLGLFLHTHGASQLWRQMIVNGDSINPQIALSLALADLRALQPQVPLLSIDGLDLLADSETHRHIALRSLLSALAEAPDRSAALIGIGQALGAVELAQVVVPGLDVDAVDEFLRRSAVMMPQHETVRVFEYTRGNIQALKMLTLLYHAGEQFETLFERLPELPSMTAFARRLRERLTPPEQQLVTILSVFRQPVALHAWRQELATLQQLERRQIIQVSREGSLSLWPALGDALSNTLSEQERITSHRIAATVRTQSGQHTAAAYHYIQSGRPDVAVRHWFPNREQEIRDGQAGVALALFQEIDSEALAQRDAQALALSIVQLSKLTGEVQAALDALGRTSWPADQALSAYARTMEGDLLDLQSQIAPAEEAYTAALESVSGLLERQQAVLHTRLSGLHLNRFRNLDAAWREACMARHIAELFQGEVLEERGDAAGARAHYEAALAIAQELNDPLRQARTHFNLALLGVRHRDDLEATMAHFDQAMHLYNQIGDLVRVERTRTILAAFLIETQRYHAGIEAATQALAFFERVQFSRMIGSNGNNLSEAYCALGEYSEAERFAMLVLRTEDTPSMPYALSNLGMIRHAQGRYGEAMSLLNEALEAGQDNKDRYITACVWRSLGQVHAATAQPAQARAALTQSLELFSALGQRQELERTRMLLEELATAAPG